METRDRRFFEALWWGGVLVWAGVIIGADALGYLPQVDSVEPWSWGVLGAGVYGLALNLIRAGSPSFENARTWEWILAGALTLGGLGEVARRLFGLRIAGELVPALALLLIGGAVLVNLLLRRS